MELAIIDVPIYNWTIQFLRKGTIVEAVEFLKKQDFYDDLGESGTSPLGRTWRNFNSPVTIWVKDRASKTVLTHEMFHAVYFILMARGIELGDDSEEAYTYLLDFIQEAYDKVKWRKVK